MTAEQGPEDGAAVPQPEEADTFDWGAPTRFERALLAFGRGLKEAVVVVAMALILSIGLRTFIFQMFYVPSGSMLETLQIGDKIVASKITKTMRGIDRGDIVVFHDPGDWLSAPVTLDGWRGDLQRYLTWVGLLPSNSGEDLVKRVVGVAGDRVSCCSPDGRISVNGVVLTEDAYIVAPTNQLTFDITVPEGRIFVMGDNRGNSQDSRYHLDVEQGTVPLDEVRGVVHLIIWPPQSIGWKPAPDALTDPALDAAKSK